MISDNDVKNVASLARIHLKSDEIDQLKNDLGHILDYIKKLENLDVSDVEPTSHALPLKNVHRDDAVEPSLKQSDALSIAVKADRGSFKVPKVIE